MKKLFLLLLLFAAPVQAQVTVALSPTPKQQFFSALGVPLSSGCVNTYITGTSTPLATYVDGTGATQNANPIILDGGGFANIWLSNASYRFVVVAYDGIPGNKCAAGITQYTVDSINAYAPISTGANLFLLGQANDPAGTGGELIYRNDIPCIRAFTIFWDCIVRLTDTQTLTNKTLTSPTITNPTLSGLSNLAITGGGSWTGSPSLTNPVINGIDAQGGTTYTVVASDEQKLLTFNNAAGVTVTLPQAVTTGFGAGTVFHMRNLGSVGTVLINPAGGTIDGLTQLQLVPGQGADIYSDGGNYSTQKGGTSSEVAVGGATIFNFNATTNEDSAGSTVFFLANAHTLTRLLARVDIAGITCSTAATVALKDVNTASITTLTLPVNPSVGNVDSGTIAVNLTAGHMFALIVNAAATGCGTFPQGKILAVYQ